MGFGDTEPMEDEDGGEGLSYGGSSVSCSICLEAVKGTEDRSTATLKCGHEFHLDCIGSAFNAKGVMQCPNCRKIEKGQWFYANGHHTPFSDFSYVDWTHEDELYDLAYSEMPFGVHWCPFNGLTRVSSSFEDGESPQAAFHDLLAHDAVFAEHHWNGLFGLGDIPNSHAFPAGDLHYRIWDHIGGTEPSSFFSATPRPPRSDSDGLPRSGSVLHPFLHNHGSGSRAGSSVTTPMVPPYPIPSPERVEGLHPYHNHPLFHPPNIRSRLFPHVGRSNSPRSLAPVGPPPPSSDHASGFYVLPSSGSSGRNIQETVNPLQNHFYPWERDRFAPFPLVPIDRESGWWATSHLAAGLSDLGSRASNHRHRHGSDRTSLQSRTENPSYQSVHPPGHPYI